jgi:hypothetical protein
MRNNAFRERKANSEQVEIFGEAIITTCEIPL